MFHIWELVHSYFARYMSDLANKAMSPCPFFYSVAHDIRFGKLLPAESMKREHATVLIIVMILLQFLLPSVNFVQA